MHAVTQFLLLRVTLRIRRATAFYLYIPNKYFPHEITLTLLLGLKLRIPSRQFDDQSTY